MNKAELKQFVQNGFNEASAGYDKAAMRFFDKSAEHLVSLLPLKGSEHFLDIATGTGKIAMALANRLPAGHVTGFDLSEGMLQHARAKSADQKNMTWRCLDANEADFPAGSFDGATCGFGVFFWPDMEATLKNLSPVIKPGGHFAMTSFADGSFLPQSELCLETFKRYGVKPPETYSWQRLDSIEKHHALLKTVGFEEMDSQVKPMGYYLKGPEEWWDIVTYTGFRSLLNQLPLDQMERYREEHLQEIAGTTDGNGIYLNVDVIFTVSRMPS